MNQALCSSPDPSLPRPSRPRPRAFGGHPSPEPPADVLDVARRPLCALAAPSACAPASSPSRRSSSGAKSRLRQAWAWMFFCVWGFACVGTTGSEIVEFRAYAAGPADASPSGGPYEFDNAAGFHVRLTEAVVHLGAIYLNRSRPIQGAQDTPCILPGVYAGQVTAGLDVQSLSSALQPFPVLGDGTADRALAGEVWLTGARIDALDDRTPILAFSGEASRNGTSLRFRGTISIGKNRLVESADPATPGANPLCKTRIVTPIPVELTPSRSGALVVRVLPRIWFDAVDFSKLQVADGAEAVFADEMAGQPATSLFLGLRSVSAYQFSWQPLE